MKNKKKIKSNSEYSHGFVGNSCREDIALSNSIPHPKKFKIILDLETVMKPIEWEEYILEMIECFRNEFDMLDDDLKLDYQLNTTFLEPCQIEIIEFPEAPSVLWIVTFDKTQSDKKINVISENQLEYLNKRLGELTSHYIDSNTLISKLKERRTGYYWSALSDAACIYILPKDYLDRGPKEVATERLHNALHRRALNIRNKKLYLRVRETAYSFFSLINKILKESPSEDTHHRILLDEIYNLDSFMLSLFLVGRIPLPKDSPYYQEFAKCTDLFNSCIDIIVQDAELRRINNLNYLLNTSPWFKEVLKYELAKLFQKLCEEFYRFYGNISQAFERGLEQKILIRFMNFDKYYVKYEDYIYSNTINFKFILPLMNFRCELDTIEIANGVRITKTPLEIMRMGKTQIAPFYRHVFQYSISIPEYSLELNFQIKKWSNVEISRNGIKDKGTIIGEKNETVIVSSILLSQDMLYDILDKVVTSLRLLKRGDIGVNVIYISVPSPFEEWKLFESSPDFSVSVETENVYELKSSEIGGLIGIYKKLSSLRLLEKSRLSIAIRRFNYAYTRWKHSDRLIDLAISFESLYSKKGDPKEGLTHRLTTRAAKFLVEKNQRKGSEDIFEKRMDTRRKLKKIYGKRSAIIHGSDLDVDAELVFEFEEHIRDSIKKFIDDLNKSNHDEIINKLDLE